MCGDTSAMPARVAAAETIPTHSAGTTPAAGVEEDLRGRLAGLARLGQSRTRTHEVSLDGLARIRAQRHPALFAALPRSNTDRASRSTASGSVSPPR